MYKNIGSVYYFNYENKIGFYRSFKNFSLTRMVYLEVSLSTPAVHVQASPNHFQISQQNSSIIREYLINRIDSLKEICKPQNYTPSKYIQITYVDGTSKYFEYNDEFCYTLNNAENYKQPGNTDDIIDTPYLVLTGSRSAKIAIILEQIADHIKNKQFAKILPYLHCNCILKELYSNKNNILTSKSAIQDRLKKERGFSGSKLRSVSFDTYLEGCLLRNNQSTLGIHVDMTDQAYHSHYYLLLFSFNVDFSISGISIYTHRFDHTSKTFYSLCDVELLKKGIYNDFNNLHK